MRQKAKLLLDEAATWSLLWHLYGKGNISLSLYLYTPEKKLCISPGIYHNETFLFILNFLDVMLSFCEMWTLQQKSLACV